MVEAGYWQVALMVVVPGAVVASVLDYRTHRVPNWLNATLAGSGLMAQGWFFGWPGLANGMLGLLVGLAVLIVPWAMHGMGAGDVKLMAAIGAWFGPWMTFVAFCAGALVGGLIAAGMIVAKGRLWQAWSNLGLLLVKLRSLETAFGQFGSVENLGSTTVLLPYGIALSIGSVAVLIGQAMGWWVL